MKAQKKENTYVARRYQAPDGAEMLGYAAVSYLDNLVSHQVIPIFKKYGYRFEDFAPDKWYSLQFFYDIAAEANPTQDYMLDVATGKSAANLLLESITDPDATSFIEIYMNSVYTKIYRNLPDGYGLRFKKLAEGHYQITNNTAGANAGVYGFLWESLRRLTENHFTIEVVEGSDIMSESPVTFEVTFTQPSISQ